MLPYLQKPARRRMAFGDHVGPVLLAAWLGPALAIGAGPMWHGNPEVLAAGLTVAAPALTPTAALGDAAAVTAVTSAVVAALQRHSDSARLETLGNEVLDVLDDGAPEAAAVKLALLVLVRTRSRSSRLL